MSLELVYTSAPKGLKPGSRGFCTVAMTQGMTAQLVDRLEALSGYRQVFAPQDPQAGLNPVVCSHLRISVTGRNYHVLSRVCAAGLDYSQRTNKFAHHVVLDANELPQAGPAWLLAVPGFMATAWDQTTRLLPPRPRPPAGNSAPAVCQSWQQTTGDAAWGGVLIDAAIKNPKGLVTLIFKPGQDPLPLLAESLALMPAELRWQATFSTYYTKLPPGVECRWRCVVEGSPEAKTAAGVVIDLCHRLGQPPAGEYVTAARTGRVPISAKPPRQFKAESPGDTELAQLLVDPTIPAAPSTIRAPVESADWPGALQPFPPSLPPGVTADSNSTLRRRRFREKEALRWPYVVGMLAVALLMIVGGLALYLASRGDKSGQQLAQTEERAAPPAATVSPPTPAKSADAGKPPPAPKPPDLPHQQQRSDATPATKNPSADNRAGGMAPHTTGTSDSGQPSGPPTHAGAPAANTSSHTTPKPPARSDPFSEFRHTPPAGIPEYKPHSLVGGPSTGQSEQKLGHVNGVESSKVGLQLVGDTKLTGGVQFALEETRNMTSEGTKLWSCYCNGATQPTAAFSLGRAGNLVFRWSESTVDPQKPNTLCNQLIKLTSSDPESSVVVPLRRPELDEPLRFGVVFDGNEQQEASVSRRYLPVDARLCFEFIKPVAANGGATIIIKQESNDDKATLSVDCGPPTLKLLMNAQITTVKQENGASSQIVVKYRGVELDPADWRPDVPMVKSSPFRLTIAQVQKHIGGLKAERSSATDLAKELAARHHDNDPKIARLAAATSKDDKIDKEIKSLRDEISAAEKKLAVRKLSDAMQELTDNGVAFRVYYQALDKEQKPHDVDLITVPVMHADADKTATTNGVKNQD